MGEALGLRHPQPLENPQDQQGRQPLRRRGEIVVGAARQLQGQRLAHLGREAAQVLASDGAADALEVFGDLAAHIAPVEIIEALLGQMIEGRPQRLIAQQGSLRGDLALAQIDGCKARRLRQRPQIGLAAGLRGGHGDTFAGMADGVGDEIAQGQAPPDGARIVQGQRPAAHGAGHGEGGVRPTRGDGLVFAALVAGQGGLGAGGPAGLEGAYPALGLAQQPEAIPADGVHVGIDHRDGRGHGHHGLHRIAAHGQHIAPGVRRRLMGGGDGGGGENLSRSHGSLTCCANRPDAIVPA